MANSRIWLSFTGIPVMNDWLKIAETNLGLTLNERFRPTRVSSFQTKIPSGFDVGTEDDPVIIYTGFISDNYKTAFNLDYNGTSLFTVTSFPGELQSGLGDVLIEANFPGAVFEEVLTPSYVTVTIENDGVGELPDFNITELAFQQANSSPCQNVRVGVTTDGLAVTVIEPVTISGNTDNPFSFDWPRGQSFNLKLQDENGTEINQSVTTPSVLNSANFSLTINGSPNGSTVIVNSSNSDGLTLEYSLDGTDWQSSNVFSGLEPDDFTLYVRDQLGCSFQMDFTVNEFGVYSPYFYISKSNPIRYANRITWGDSSNYKNDENTLSCEVENKSKYKEIQQFQSADLVTTQFKSNYSENIATVIRSTGNEVNVPVVQKTANIGIKEKRDAVMYDYGSGKNGIYFTVGNIYNYDSNAVVDTFALYGSLPVWAAAGNYVVIDNAWYLIEDIIFDETKNAEVLLITNNYTGPEMSLIVGCIFNILDYEVYEFVVDMGAYIGENIQVRINNNTVNFPSIVHLSELINIQVRQKNTVEIKYWNNDNTDVFYATGVRFMIRQLIQQPAGALTDDKSENYKTDSNVILLSDQIFEGDEFIFEPVTKEMMRKILLALSHVNLFIDGIGYVKNDAADVEGPLEESNLYVIKAKMTKSGYSYNSQASGGGDSIYNGENTNVPGLIDFGGGLVRY